MSGRYVLVDEIGRGAYGVVWRAWDGRDHVWRAAKVLREADAVFLLRFLREQAVRIRHPHVVTPVGWAGDDEGVLLTMPLVAGGSLLQLLDERGTLPAPWAARVALQLADALSAVHAEGVTHRDVKPGNVLLRPTGAGEPHAYLGDFGIARREEDPRLTEGSLVLGTRRYLAPEAWEAGSTAPPIDVFAAGVLLAQLRLGLAADAPALRAAPPEPLLAIAAAMTHEDPAARPTPAQVRAAIDATGLAHAPLDGSVVVPDRLPPLPAGWTAEGPGTDETGRWQRAAEAASALRIQASAPTAPPARASRRGLLLPAALVTVGAALCAAAVALLLPR
ncbi:serine/threonine-protein kinase [Agrococcus sp. SGAir0287]|uniref:serine/threonine-protein kinase n=1 Tax=Agrococcus sp. SGAir0287 TaxID=2070347 RepID=UPI0015861583|nr:serine/threonine-protein kinase [Agrococcus sp. SGAir0287]